MGHFDAGIGVIELFYPDLGEAKVFYQDVLGPPADRQDDTSASFVLGEQAREFAGMVGGLGLHRELELGGFPSDATRGRPESKHRPQGRSSRNRNSRRSRARVNS